MEVFQAPLACDELAGKPVEQFRMRGPLALGAKVFQSRDDAAPEILMPDPVHRDAGRERVLRVYDPSSQVQTSQFATVKPGAHHCRSARLDLDSGTKEVAAHHHLSLASRTKGERLGSVQHRARFLE